MNRYGKVGGEVLFFPHGSTHSRVVSILLNPLRTLNVEATGKDPDGRIAVSVNLIYSSGRISICSVYAPNDSRQQHKFFLNLNSMPISKAVETKLGMRNAKIICCQTQKLAILL